VRVRAAAAVDQFSGFSHNREMREQFQAQPNSWRWTNANPGDTGDDPAAMRLGAAVDCMNEPGGF